MKSFTTLLLAALLGTQSVLAAATPDPNKGNYLTDAHRAKMVHNYLAIWKGNLSLLNSTFSPTMSFYADRFPSDSGVGSDLEIITTPAQFGEFVTSSAIGFEKYGFEAWYWLGQGKYISIRWFLDGVVGNLTQFPTSLKPGDKLTYNGTDNLVLNPCTGLVDEVDSAQDLISLFHNLGLKSVTV